MSELGCWCMWALIKERPTNQMTVCLGALFLGPVRLARGNRKIYEVYIVYFSSLYATIRRDPVIPTISLLTKSA